MHDKNNNLYIMFHHILTCKMKQQDIETMFCSIFCFSFALGQEQLQDFLAFPLRL
jgi:hypothetical protein